MMVTSWGVWSENGERGVSSFWVIARRGKNLEDHAEQLSTSDHERVFHTPEERVPTFAP